MAVNLRVAVVEPRHVDDPERASRPTVETIFGIDGFELCRTRLTAGESSDWHHHGEHTAYGVVLGGRARLEFGPDEADSAEVGPGEFFLVPAGVVHREVATDEAHVALVGFAGRGPLVIDGDAPEAVPPVRPRRAGDADLVPADALENLTRLTPFPHAAVQQVRGHAAGAVESGWHHHGDNHVLGYVAEGQGYVEWDTGPEGRALVRAGECFHLQPGVVHRDVNPSDADQRYLLWLTGSEPRTVPVDGPPGGVGG